MLRALQGINQGAGITSTSYSQFGEDLVMAALCRWPTEGTYLDVGCNDPVRYSNTYWLYEKGWSGIAIDANPKFENRWRRLRPRDTFVPTLVSNSPGERRFYFADDDLVSSGHDEWASVQTDVVQGEVLQSQSLDEILRRQKVDAIDLVSIDCEGMDAEVLSSLDLQRYPVGVILIESVEGSDDELVIASRLAAYGYCKMARIGMSTLWQRRQM
jgi:FkbM family methyltransferase